MRRAEAVGGSEVGKLNCYIILYILCLQDVLHLRFGTGRDLQENNGRPSRMTSFCIFYISKCFFLSCHENVN